MAVHISPKLLIYINFLYSYLLETGYIPWQQFSHVILQIKFVLGIFAGHLVTISAKLFQFLNSHFRQEDSPSLLSCYKRHPLATYTEKPV